MFKSFRSLIGKRFQTRKNSTFSGKNNKWAKIGKPIVFLTGVASAIGIGFYSYRSYTINAQAAAIKNALDKSANKEFIQFPLEEVKDINHNTKILKFKLDDDEQLGRSSKKMKKLTILGLPVSSCIVVKLDNVIGKDGNPGIIYLYLYFLIIFTSCTTLYALRR